MYLFGLFFFSLHLQLILFVVVGYLYIVICVFEFRTFLPMEMRWAKENAFDLVGHRTFLSVSVHVIKRAKEYFTSNGLEEMLLLMRGDSLIAPLLTTVDRTDFES